MRAHFPSPRHPIPLQLFGHVLYCVALLLTGAASPLLAQRVGSSRATGALFLELEGNAGLLGATVNAELLLSRRVGLRAGVGSDLSSYTTVIPLQAVVLIGEGPSKLELAAGVT